MKPEVMKYGLTDAKVPLWLRFPYITTGYRLGGTYTDAVLGLFRWHNEFINAWTMVISLLVGTCLMLHTILTGPPHIVGPTLSMWIGQALHHPFSIAYHLCMPLSEDVFHRYRSLDVCFILIMNVFATLGLAWAAWGKTVGIICATVCGLIAGAGMLYVLLNQEHKRVSRVTIITLIGITALGYYGPVVARAIVAVRNNHFMSHAFIGAIILLVGHGLAGIAYGTHFPQRLAPHGQLDSVCTSQILAHLLVTSVYNYGYMYIKHV